MRERGKNGGIPGRQAKVQGGAEVGCEVCAGRQEVAKAGRQAGVVQAGRHGKCKMK